MAYASTLGGIAIALAGTILPHGLGQPVSGLVDMPHGASMAASLGYIMEISYTSNIEKFAQLAECFGEPLHGLSTYAKAEKSVEFVQRLLKDTGAEVTFGEYGLKESDLEKTAEIAINNYSFDLNNSPLKVSKEEIIDIYRNCL
jgi:alcohol dehydrogenase class IV